MISQIKKIINHRSETITNAAFVVSILALIGSFLGIIRNALLAGSFGAGEELDIYYAAFRIPDFIFNIFIVGAISAGFIPFFSKYLEQSEEKAWRFASSIFFWTGLSILILAFLVIIFTYPVLSLILVGFSPEKLSAVVLLTRIMMIQPLFLGFSVIAGSILETFKYFTFTALSPLLYNLGIIIGIIFFTPIFGLVGLAYGVVLGAFLSLIIKIFPLFKIGFKWNFNFSKATEDLKEIFLIMIPRTLGIITYQIFLFIIVGMSTFLEEGSLAIFNFANDIQNLPQTIFAVSFAVAAFPRLSQLEAQNKKDLFIDLFNEILLKILFWLIPISAFFLVFRAQIIRLLLGYGYFGWADTFLTIDVFTILIFGMIFQGLLAFLTRAFFAQKDVVKPFIAAFLAYGLGAFLCFYLGMERGIVGIAIAFVLANIIYFALLFLFLIIRFKTFPFKIFINGISKIISASFVASVVGYLLLRITDLFLDTHRVIGLISQTALSFLGAIIVFIIIGKLLKIQEIQNIYILTKEKFNIFLNLLLRKLKP